MVRNLVREGNDRDHNCRIPVSQPNTATRHDGAGRVAGERLALFIVVDWPARLSWSAGINRRGVLKVAIPNLKIQCPCGHTEYGRHEVPSVIAFFCQSCKKKRAVRIEVLHDDGRKSLIVTEMDVRDLVGKTSNEALQITVEPSISW